MRFTAARKGRAPVLLLIAITALGPLALNIVLPSLSSLTEAFATDYGTAQLALSLYLIGFAVGQLAYGPMSDRYGRRPMALAGLLLFLAGTVLAASAQDVVGLLVGRVLQALGASAGMVLGRAIVRDLFDRERSASILAFLMMAMVVVPMLAPLIGGTVDSLYGWRTSYLVCLVAGGAVLLAVWVWLGETLPAPQPLPGLRGMMHSYACLLRRHAFRVYAAQVAFSSAAFFAFLGGAPYVTVEIMGRSPAEYGAWFTIGAAAYMLGNMVSGFASQRAGIERMVLAGTAASLLGVLIMFALALAGFVHPLAVFLPMALNAFGNGLSLPNGLAGAVSVDPALAGAASGLSGFLQMGVGAAASILVGHLIAGRESQLLMVTVMLGGATLAFGAALLTPRPPEPAPAAQPAV